MNTTAQFYDEIADVYHLIYADWDRSIDVQGQALAGVIEARWENCHRVLDAACGIGTQSLGLASAGFEVTASDISEASVARARREAAARQLDICFEVADLRDLSAMHSSRFDVVIACDNAIPHLLSDNEILRAFRQMRSLLRPGGGCVVSARDYSTMKGVGTQMLPYGTRVVSEERVHVFQVWDFLPDSLYDLSMFFVWERQKGPEARVFRSRCYAVSLERLESLLMQAGFIAVECLPQAFFQPLLVATNPNPS
ncbi:MAG: class I SAM-dependent methyltransferase [Thermoanaerobaculia bacterium]|nr:class I SAM-dependent methyltransferase [Thermoanaerobaculia bacterium]